MGSFRRQARTELRSKAAEHALHLASLFFQLPVNSFWLRHPSWQFSLCRSAQSDSNDASSCYPSCGGGRTDHEHQQIRQMSCMQSCLRRNGLNSGMPAFRILSPGRTLGSECGSLPISAQRRGVCGFEFLGLVACKTARTCAAAHGGKAALCVAASKGGIPGFSCLARAGYFVLGVGAVLLVGAGVTILASLLLPSRRQLTAATTKRLWYERLCQARHGLFFFESRLIAETPCRKRCFGKRSACLGPCSAFIALFRLS